MRQEVSQKLEISEDKSDYMLMSDVIIGKGNLAGKGVYANRDFKKGEMITGDATKDDIS